ncbi:MAG: hypothetical protein JWN78_1971 [Bacteroidota bacterium]|nr:hypothetical protein [Bacteroidota bacterium]
MNYVTRKDFLRWSVMGSVGLYLNSCHTKPTKENIQSENVIINDTSQRSTDLSPDVTFYKRSDPEYEKLRTGFNKRIQKFPLIIAQCKSSQDISVAVKYAQKNNLAVSVKSGGHCFEGFSSNNDGLVIDLSLMNTIESIDEHTVKVGPGCTLAQLNDHLLPQNKIIPAGSCGGVGIGGLTLGGGYGLFSRKYGLTCDSLLDITFIDGNGNILTGSQEKDLLWACRGGENGNFGIVSEMIFKTYDTPAAFRSHRFKSHKADAAHVEKMLEKWFEVTAELPLSCFSAFVLNNKTVYILLTDFEHHEETVEAFKTSLGPLTDTIQIGKPQPLEQALKVFRGKSAPLFFKNSSAGLYENYETIRPFIKEVISKVIETPGMIYQINTLGGNIQQPEFEKTSAYPHRALPYLSELQTYWEVASRSKYYETKFEEVQSIFKANNITAQYRNYPDIQFNDWEKSYYGKSYERLQQIKTKYDPHNIFRYEQSVRSNV